MSNLGQRLDHFFRGFGGVLLISLIGIGILVFAGILPAQRQIAQVREDTARISDRIALARQTEPLLKAIGKRGQSLREMLGQSGPVEPYPAADFDRLVPDFTNRVLTGFLNRPRVDIRLTSQGRRDQARLALRGEIQYENLPELFSALDQWPHWDRIISVSIRAGESDLDFSCTLSVPLQ
jgi:hypothetical protein